MFPSGSTVRRLLLILLVPMLVSCGPSKKKGIEEKPLISGRILTAEGDVRVNRLPAESGSPISDGSTISTGPDSYCEIEFLKGNIIRIDRDTLITLSFAESAMILKKGSAAGVLRNLTLLMLGANKAFNIESGSVVAGIRGTTFYVRREDPDTTYFCLCNGTVTVSDSKQQLTQPLQAVHHSALRIRDVNGRLEMSRAEMEYHDDMFMEDLAGKIGQTMDWTRLE